MKTNLRKIKTFLAGEKGSKKHRSEQPEVYESSDGRFFVVAILEGSVDKEAKVIRGEMVQTLFADTAEQLEEYDTSYYVEVA